MAGLSVFDPIRRRLRERARTRRIRLAALWPKAVATINLWKLLPAGDAAESFTQTDIIEASFAFVLNGEYYGGYLRSIAMGHHDAERLAAGSPQIAIRYNPANPDEAVVLAEDNAGTLPFEVVSG